MPGEYAVIGAGQFGRAVALSLVQQGETVLVVDRRADLLEELAADVEAVMALDSTDEQTLVEAGIDRVATVVVAIGTDSREASIMTTALLSQLGVPRIVARAANELHARVLRAVGAHEVVTPEEEMGRRLALRLVRPGIKEQLELGNATLAEVDVPEQLVGQSLRQTDLRNRFHLSVVVIKRGEQVLPNPAGDEEFQPGDVLVLFGDKAAIARLAALV
jgi:trk system potassium uptake protein TrkA